MVTQSHDGCHVCVIVTGKVQSVPIWMRNEAIIVPMAEKAPPCVPGNERETVSCVRVAARQSFDLGSESFQILEGLCTLGTVLADNEHFSVLHGSDLRVFLERTCGCIVCFIVVVSENVDVTLRAQRFVVDSGTDIGTAVHDQLLDADLVLHERRDLRRPVGEGLTLDEELVASLPREDGGLILQQVSGVLVFVVQQSGDVGLEPSDRGVAEAMCVCRVVIKERAAAVVGLHDSLWKRVARGRV
mmetsp:Transcript_20724/g.30538  ORF Transcript_20724/g.30538 Transcript_20724/m.30538 type:complete len:244 (-) Transcript_20724:377-1108(-)